MDTHQIERIGPHRLLAGDLTTGCVAALMAGELADVVYTDPPWGPGLLQMFATMNATGSAPRLPWPEFLRALCRVCAAHRNPGAPVFVEMGLRWVDDLRAAMADVGLPFVWERRISYGPKKDPRPSALLLFGADVDVHLPDPPHGESVTLAVLGPVVQPGTRVLDPCTGLGMTARHTHSYGGHFYGLELNPKRLERTAAWLRKATR